MERESDARVTAGDGAKTPEKCLVSGFAEGMDTVVPAALLKFA